MAHDAGELTDAEQKPVGDLELCSKLARTDIIRLKKELLVLLIDPF